MNAEAARFLLRRARSGTLASALAEDGGRPYASLVTLAFDTDLSPIFLLSDLSDHTRNLRADPRASILCEEASRRANPQTGPRVSLIGTVREDARPRVKRRFLARHPSAAFYAGFADFHVFRMGVERAHFVGGFGRAEWLPAAAVLVDRGPAEAIAACEETILAEMNEAQPQTIDLYANQLLARRGSGWRLAAVDPQGCDLCRGVTVLRLPFPHPATDASSLRQAFAALADQARNAPAAKKGGAGEHP